LLPRDIPKKKDMIILILFSCCQIGFQTIRVLIMLVVSLVYIAIK
jgi:hypothetical protein